MFLIMSYNAEHQYWILLSTRDTEPEALEELNRLRGKGEIEARLFRAEDVTPNT